MLRVEIEQLLLVGGKPEEIALFFDPFDRRALRPNAFASLIKPSFVLIVIRFIADRVPARILTEVNVARRLHPLPDADRCPMVTLLGGADEFVVGTIESFHHRLEARNIAFDELLWSKPLLRRRLQHFNAVLVRAS